MDIRFIILFLGMTLPIGLGTYIIIIDKRSIVNRLFLVLTYLISFLFFCKFLLLFIEDESLTLFWAKAMLLGLFSYPLFICIIIEFLLLFQQERIKRFITEIILFFQPFCIFIYLAFSDFHDISLIKHDIGYQVELSKSFLLGIDTWGTLSFLIALIVFIIKTIGSESKMQKNKKKIVTSTLFLILILLLFRLVNHQFIIIPLLYDIYLLFAIFSLLLGTLTYGIHGSRMFYLNPSTASEHIIATMKDGLFICDRDHYIHFINKFASALTGFSSSELRGLSFNDLLFDEKYNPAKLNDILTNYLDSEIDLILKTKDRGSLPCSCIFSFFQVNGTISPGYICIVRNISTRKVAEAALKAAKEKSENANRAKSEFLANMSHEIRNPLNTILGMSDMLKQLSHTPEQEDFFDAITHSGNILLRLINNVLDMAQIESGKLQISNSDFNFYEIAHAVYTIEKQHVQSKQKNLGIVFEYEEHLPTWFSGDVTRIQEILLNLLSNAVKFTEKGFVKLHITGPKKYSIGKMYLIHMIIEDTGIGIPSSKLKDIFKAFYQVDGTVTRKYGGSGLGLAIIHKLILKMKGKIQVNSEEGRGTIFNIQIPLKVISQDEKKEEKDTPAHTTPHVAKQKDIKADASGDDPGNKAVILIAEDDDLNRKMLTRMVTVLGFGVDTAENGKEVLSILRRKTFSLILMDNHMPDMDGITATTFIRKKMGLTVPIIGLTGDVFKETREKCLKAGMNRFLSKPFRMDELKILIDQLIE